jgi:hypothetical protein
LDLSNEIAEKYPDLVQSYTNEGNAVIALTELYKKLAEER